MRAPTMKILNHGKVVRTVLWAPLHLSSSCLSACIQNFRAPEKNWFLSPVFTGSACQITGLSLPEPPISRVKAQSLAAVSPKQCVVLRNRRAMAAQADIWLQRARLKEVALQG